jgi:hypothetical protein
MGRRPQAGAVVIGGAGREWVGHRWAGRLRVLDWLASHRSVDERLQGGGAELAQAVEAATGELAPIVSEVRVCESPRAFSAR